MLAIPTNINLDDMKTSEGNNIALCKEMPKVGVLSIS